MPKTSVKKGTKIKSGAAAKATRSKSDQLLKKGKKSKRIKTTGKKPKVISKPRVIPKKTKPSVIAKKQPVKVIASPSLPIRKLGVRAVGKRKSAIAQIILKSKGKGLIIINRQELKKYFPYFEFQDVIISPLKIVGIENKYDFTVKVQGGGTRSQAEAIRLGISRVLIKINPDCRPSLKKVGFLTRDARIKERKKPGLKRARRAPQWSKR